MPIFEAVAPAGPVKFNVRARAVSLGYNEVHYKSLEFGRNLEGTFSEARINFFQ